NSNINGIVHKDRVRLALMASYKNKTLLQFYADETDWLDDDEVEDIQALGSILKFANALNVSDTGVVKELYLEEKDDEMVQTVEYQGDPSAEEYQAKRQKKLIEKIMNEDKELRFTET